MDNPGTISTECYPLNMLCVNDLLSTCIDIKWTRGNEESLQACNLMQPAMGTSHDSSRHAIALDINHRSLMENCVPGMSHVSLLNVIHKSQMEI